MSRIKELAERIMAAQTRLGLENPTHHRKGLSNEELLQSAPFSNIAAGSELHDLYSWRDGVATEGIPMGKLWIKPGYYLVSAHDSVSDNRYGAAHLSDWLPSWYPILTDGAGSRCFIETSRASKGLQSGSRLFIMHLVLL